MTSSSQVVHNPEKHRFELPIADDAFVAAYYRLDDEGRMVLIHTEVPSEYSGRGYASALARGVFDHARAEGIRLVLRCPFMRDWYARHPDYGDVVDG